MNKRILIFASGRGSNAEALHEAAVDGTIKGMIVGVICDHHDAQVLQRAERWKVPATVIEMKTCRDKADYNEKILEAAKSYAPDLICLAGYMRICGENLIKAFENRIINIHPALLPSFRGLHAQRQAIEAGVKVAGCTVHLWEQGLMTAQLSRRWRYRFMIMIRKIRFPHVYWRKNIPPMSAQ